MPTRRGLLPLGCLAVMFVLLTAYYSRLSYDILHRSLNATTVARAPFSLSFGEPRIDDPEDEAKAAGLKSGDLLRRLDASEPFRLTAVSDAALARNSGDTLPVEVERDGATIATNVRLKPLRGGPLPLNGWILTIFVGVLTPWLCMLLGFTVAFLRPRDPLAWLLLFLMLSFSSIARMDLALPYSGWGWLAGIAGLAYHDASAAAWPVCMLLFGQYFPDRVANSRWDKIARWGLGVPLTLSLLAQAAIGGARMADIRSLAGLQHVIDRAAPVLQLLGMAAVSLFFVYTSEKMRRATSPDAKRRMKLLYFGTSVALTPLFLLVIGTLVLRKELTSLSTFLLVPAFLCTFLFPATLAYVIVVERAMDLKVAIRQGLQYAFARRAVFVVQFLATAGILLYLVFMASGPGLRRPQQMQLLAYAVGIAVGFQRLAQWFQKFIDRRFFREAVDAERVLNHLSDKVRTIVEAGPLLQTVSETVASTLHITKVAALIRQNGHFEAVHTLGWDEGIVQKTFEASNGVAEQLRESFHSELLLPLPVQDRVLGYLSLGPRLAEAPYSTSDVRLLRSVATQTGLALENSRLTAAIASETAQRERLNRELEIAREVQERLFPQEFPKIAGMDYAGKCRPALSIGGDYYDFIPMSRGRLGVAIGDVSGKGVAAALLMANLQASLRGLAAADPPLLAPMMGNLNKLIFASSPSNKYATFFYGVYDPATRVFTYVNGGHNAPMVFRGKDVARLEDGGPVVGLFGPADYSQGSVTLAEGDTMVLFTDGVSEAMNFDDEEFGDDRMIATVQGRLGDAAKLIEEIIRAADEFAGGAPQHDDMTLVVLRM
jgi:phosphoserine phosphatase RsbU/P